MLLGKASPRKSWGEEEEQKSVLAPPSSGCRSLLFGKINPAPIGPFVGTFSPLLVNALQPAKWWSTLLYLYQKCWAETKLRDALYFCDTAIKAPASHKCTTFSGSLEPETLLKERFSRLSLHSLTFCTADFEAGPRALPLASLYTSVHWCFKAPCFGAPCVKCVESCRWSVVSSPFPSFQLLQAGSSTSTAVENWNSEHIFPVEDLWATEGKRHTSPWLSLLSEIYFLNALWSVEQKLVFTLNQISFLEAVTLDSPSALALAL